MTPSKSKTKKAAKKVAKKTVKKAGAKAAPKKAVKVAKSAKSSGNAATKLAIVQEDFKLLKRYYPDAHCALIHKNPFELLVATILSAQCTDERVNQTTPALFERFPTPEAMAKGSVEEISHLIRSINFFNNKAKSLKSCAQDLVSKYHGQVPDDGEALVELAGVGRKTANVVLGVAFGIPNGIVVDTHVARLSHRLGWSKGNNPVVIEQELIKVVPKEDWIDVSHLLISHGRAICKARKPDCTHCFLEETCPKKGV